MKVRIQEKPRGGGGGGEGQGIWFESVWNWFLPLLQVFFFRVLSSSIRNSEGLRAKRLVYLYYFRVFNAVTVCINVFVYWLFCKNWLQQKAKATVMFLYIGSFTTESKSNPSEIITYCNLLPLLSNLIEVHLELLFKQSPVII